MVYIAKIPGYHNYLATKCGKVLSLRFCKVTELKPHTHPKGYKQVALWRAKRQKTRWVHDLVLSAFVRPKREGEVCLHENDDPADNRLGNIRWGTPAENSRQMVERGRTCKGRFSDEEIKQIRMAPGTQAVVARKFGVHQSYISMLRSGERGPRL